MTTFANDPEIRSSRSAASVWTVTSPHGMRDGADAGWRPFGRRHALLPGSRRTACGQDAHTWRRFGRLDFEAGHPDACGACADLAS